MDFLANLRIISLPSWLKWLVATLLFFAFLVNVYIFSEALSESRESWINAGAQLLGIILPIAILALIMGFSWTGVSAVTQKTDELLRTNVPAQLRRIPDHSLIFASHRTDSHQHPTIQVNVESIFEPGSCFGDYEIEMKGQQNYRLICRVEVNVQKINVNLYIAQQKANSIDPEFDPQNKEHCDYLFETFKHSIKGASGLPIDSELQIRYWVNDKLLQRIHKNEIYYCVVLSTFMHRDFLWDPAKILYFTQDLMLMFRSFLSEAPTFFLDEEVDNNQKK